LLGRPLLFFWGGMTLKTIVYNACEKIENNQEFYSCVALQMVDPNARHSLALTTYGPVRKAYVNFFDQPGYTWDFEQTDYEEMKQVRILAMLLFLNVTGGDIKNGLD